MKHKILVKRTNFKSVFRKAVKFYCEQQSSEFRMRDTVYIYQFIFSVLEKAKLRDGDTSS